MNRAKSNLVRAGADAHLDEVYLEDLCFDCQQAAEKAIKAVLLKYAIPFPYTHDIGRLLSNLQEAGHSFPASIREAARLTRFAVAMRYPGVMEPVERDEYDQALMTATAVVHWAESILY